jgi:hypothetical protein
MFFFKGKDFGIEKTRLYHKKKTYCILEDLATLT